MPTLWFQNCRIYSRHPLTEADLTVRLEITLSGTTTALGIVVANQDYSCDTNTEERRCVAWLPGPGRYAVLYRVMNNFRRYMQDVEVVGSCDLQIHYDPPRMTIQIAALPDDFPRGGMVYLRSSSGYKGRTVDAFSEFTFNFEYTPDLFLDGYDRLGLVVGKKEYRFPFHRVPHGVLSLDFRQAREIVSPSQED